MDGVGRELGDDQAEDVVRVAVVRNTPGVEYSGAEGGECVEVARATEAVHIRDSKVTAGPVLTVTPRAWAGFVGLAADRPA
ncbi:DUF397 domain-containing protein [Streptomyces flavidovirens]